MALSPEEQKELQELEAELGADAMTPEEEKELASLEASQEHTIPSDPLDTGAVVRQFTRGALPFANQVAAAGSAALGAITEPLTDKVLGTTSKPTTFAERYQRDLETIRRQELEDKQNTGSLGTVAETAGLIGSTIATSNVLRNSNMFVNASKALNLGKKGVAAGRMAAMGTLDASYAVMRQIDSQGLNEDTKNVFKNGLALSIAAQGVVGATGKLFSAVGKTVLPAVDDFVLKSTVNRVAKKADEGIATFKNEYGEKALKDTMELLKMGSKEVLEDPIKFKDHYQSTLKMVGKQINDIYDDVDVVTGGVPIDPVKVIDTIKYRLANIPKSELGGEAIEKTMQQIDSLFVSPTTGEYGITSAKQLWNVLNDMNAGILNVDAPPAVKKTIFGGLRDSLKEANKHSREALQSRVRQGMDLNKVLEEEKAAKGLLDSLQSALDNASEQGAFGKVKVYQERVTSATENLTRLSEKVASFAKRGITPDTVKKAAEGADDISNTLAEGSDAYVTSQMDKLIKLNKKFEMLKEFDDLVLSKGLPKTSGGFLTTALKDLTSFRGVALKSSAYIAGGPAAAIAVGVGEVGLKGYAAALNKFSNETSEVVMGRQARALANSLANMSNNSTDPFVRGLTASISRTMADDNLDPDQAWAKIQADSAKYNIYQNPIKRSDASVAENFESLMNILAVEAPAMAQQLASAKDNQEDLGPMLDQLSKAPGTRKFFEGGMGWNGRVYSEEDKAMLANQVNGLFSIPESIKRQVVQEIFAKGTIPDFTKIPKRQPKVYQSRKKGGVR